jgi:uncharacterized protein (DUF302 family)
MRAGMLAFPLWAALITGLLPANAVSGEEPFVTYQVAGQYTEVLATVKEAIKGRGINIAHTLPAGEMLNRTGPDFGVERNLFSNAETVEFCSALLSHQLVQAHPQNIVLCPFTISVYELSDDPGQIRLTYRRPVSFSDPASVAAVKKVEALVQSIIKEVTEW